MNPIVWLVLGIALLVLEMITPGLFFFACFGLGALAAALAVFLGAPAWAAWAVFFGLSLMMILAVAPIARRWMKRLTTVPVGLDSLTGQTALVISAIDPGANKGQARLQNGPVWRAISDSPIAEGTPVEIIRVVGTSLQVKPISTGSISTGALS